MSRYTNLYHGIPLVLIIFLISFAGAVNPSKQNEPLYISHSLRDNGAVVTGGLCNLTLSDPDGIILVNFKAMTYNTASQKFNYTLASSNTSKLGDYCYDITCSGNGKNATETFCISMMFFIMFFESMVVLFV